jgi:hypothetical protein
MIRYNRMSPAPTRPLTRLQPQEFWAWLADVLDRDEIRLLEWSLIEGATPDQIGHRLLCGPDGVRVLIRKLIRAIRRALASREQAERRQPIPGR